MKILLIIKCKLKRKSGKIALPESLSRNYLLFNAFQVLVFLFFVFFPSANYAQGEQLSGRVINALSKEPIAFVNIVNFDDKQSGTTSDLQGFFKLKRSPNNSFKIHVNAIGYKDTIIVVPANVNELALLLQPVTYILPEFVLSSTRLKESTIGSKDNKILNINGSFVGFPSSAGWSSGVYISLPKSKQSGNIYLKSISFFISDQGPLGSAFQLRFLAPKVRWVENKLEPFSNFTDLVYERIIFRATKRGWNQIDLDNLNIILPRQPFVILFSPIYEGEKFNWLTEEGESKYGAVIAFYQSQKLKNLFWVINSEGKLAFVNNRGPGSVNPVSAIVVNFFE